MYGDAGQTACSHDKRIVGSAMKLQWFGNPGPRGMVDRGCRNPSPLTVNGFLYVQGNNRIFAQDAYNGTILWEIEIPDLRRVNIPRDTGNMCADQHSLYLAVRDTCYRLEAHTGRRIQTYSVPSAGGPAPQHWGYLATVGELIYGSAIKRDSTYTMFDGPVYWYDSTGAESTAKVCSDNLFSFSKATGKLIWNYKNGVIINSSIALGGGRAYFVESRNPTVLNLSTGRIGASALWQNQYLVALDAATGNPVWSKPVALAASPSPVVFFLTYADEKLIVLSSATNYFLYAFSAADGSLLWQKSHPWNRDNHGGHMYHTVIVGNTVFVEPMGYDLATGRLVKSGLPQRSGCSTMSAANNTITYVSGDYDQGSLYFWDLDTDRRFQVGGPRSSCWLSCISGGGLILSPTASSGCTCPYPLETSMGFGAP
jgi:outer membrane protein assembly factor BamB